jgi:hypothetical protein
VRAELVLSTNQNPHRRVCRACSVTIAKERLLKLCFESDYFFELASISISHVDFEHPMMLSTFPRAKTRFFPKISRSNYIIVDGDAYTFSSSI